MAAQAKEVALLKEVEAREAAVAQREAAAQAAEDDLWRRLEDGAADMAARTAVGYAWGWMFPANCFNSWSGGRGGDLCLDNARLVFCEGVLPTHSTANP
jgi:hypothetical protein